MKILLIHNGGLDVENASMIDIWRIWRPFRELKKHVDWDITERASFIPLADKQGKLTEEQIEEVAKELGQYDIVWSSYHFSPMTYSLCQVVSKHFGTKFVLDLDDDIWNIGKDNFGWWTKVSKEETELLQRMYLDSPWIVTSTDYLAERLRMRRKGHHKDTVMVMPNFVSADYTHKPIDNGDKIVVGYFGGASHFNDVHHTGFLEALRKIMHEYKNVYYESCGMVFEKYLPKSRAVYKEGKRGHAWYKEVFQDLNYDISVAPLEYTEFANSKSDIKWQESSMMGAAFLASRSGPYKGISYKHISTVVNTEEDWYKGLKKLIDDVEYRKSLAEASQKYVKENLLIENNWEKLKEIVETIYNAGGNSELGSSNTK